MGPRGCLDFVLKSVTVLLKVPSLQNLWHINLCSEDWGWSLTHLNKMVKRVALCSPLVLIWLHRSCRIIFISEDGNERTPEFIRRVGINYTGIMSSGKRLKSTLSLLFTVGWFISFKRLRCNIIILFYSAYIITWCILKCKIKVTRHNIYNTIHIDNYFVFLIWNT